MGLCISKKLRISHGLRVVTYECGNKMKWFCNRCPNKWWIECVNSAQCRFFLSLFVHFCSSECTVDDDAVRAISRRCSEERWNVFHSISRKAFSVDLFGVHISDIIYVMWNARTVNENIQANHHAAESGVITIMVPSFISMYIFCRRLQFSLISSGSAFQVAKYSILTRMHRHWTMKTPSSLPHILMPSNASSNSDEKNISNSTRHIWSRIRRLVITWWAFDANYTAHLG